MYIWYKHRVFLERYAGNQQWWLPLRRGSKWLGIGVRERFHWNMFHVFGTMWCLYILKKYVVKTACRTLGLQSLSDRVFMHLLMAFCQNFCYIIFWIPFCKAVEHASVLLRVWVSSQTDTAWELIPPPPARPWEFRPTALQNLGCLVYEMLTTAAQPWSEWSKREWGVSAFILHTEVNTPSLLASCYFLEASH